jgi:NADPH:quinone reductase-like Zn-dependent oxidoreductase
MLSLRTRRAARRRGVRYSFLLMRANGAQLAEIAKLVDSGALRPVVDRTYPFDDAQRALAHVEGGRAKGKVVITMASPAITEGDVR